MKKYRAVFIGVLLSLTLLLGGSVIMLQDGGTQSEKNYTVFIGSQGRIGDIGLGTGSVKAVDTSTNTVIWENDSLVRYMDVDPLNNTHVLVVAGIPQLGSQANRRIATVIDWRNNSTELVFDVPIDTHDVDKISAHKYLIADKQNNRVTKYNSQMDTRTTIFSFSDHYNQTEDGGPNHDWTHLNDVDVVKKNSILLSPRNYDRVVLYNISTQEITWELGEEDHHSVLYEQHNPSLIDTNPGTVLVADSENNRIVEYIRNNDTWTKSWSYENGLIWPRDADRLPTGETLITDTNNDRVLLVSENKQVKWEYTNLSHPYDAEIVQYENEPQGPTVQTNTNVRSVQIPNSVKKAYSISSWILPKQVTATQFLLLATIIITTLLWILIEISLEISIKQIYEYRLMLLAIIGLVLLGAILGYVLASIPMETKSVQSNNPQPTSSEQTDISVRVEELSVHINTQSGAAKPLVKYDKTWAIEYSGWGSTIIVNKTKRRSLWDSRYTYTQSEDTIIYIRERKEYQLIQDITVINNTTATITYSVQAKQDISHLTVVLGHFLKNSNTTVKNNIIQSNVTHTNTRYTVRNELKTANNTQLSGIETRGQSYSTKYTLTDIRRDSTVQIATEKIYIRTNTP